MSSWKKTLSWVFSIAIVAQLALVMLYENNSPKPYATSSTDFNENEGKSSIESDRESAHTNDLEIDNEPLASSETGSTTGGIRAHFNAKTQSLSSEIPFLESEDETGSDIIGSSDSQLAKLETEFDSAKAANDNKLSIQELVLRGCVQIIDRKTGTQGGGVVVKISDDGFEVLTACHVVQSMEKPSVFSYRRESNKWVRQEFQSTEKVRCDEKSDLAKIKIFSPIASVIAIPMDLSKASDTPSAKGGESAWRVLWKADGLPVAIQGRVVERSKSQRSERHSAVNYWVLDSPSEEGMSGGPLLSLKGSLLGIASGNSSGKAYYIDETEIMKLP